MKLKNIACLLLLLTAIPAFAATSFPLTGTTEHTQWNDLKAGATPAAPALTTLIAGSGSSAVFTKTAGPAYYAGSGNGIYSANVMDFAGFYPSSFTVADSSPIDFDTLVFQARTNQAPTSMLISLNGATTGALANIAANYFLSTEFSAGIFDQAWQWDLSSVAVPITSYEISFTIPGHTFIYASSPLTVDTASNFTQVIPEPTTGLLAVGSLGLLLTRRRRA